MESKNKIFAKDAVIGKTYLTAGMMYKVTIVNKSFLPVPGDEDFCARVRVISEIYSGEIDISGNTELLEFTEADHIVPNFVRNRVKVVKEMQVNQKNVVQKSTKGDSIMPETKKTLPRSKVIDRILLTAEEKPTAEFFDNLASEVIAAGCDVEEKRKSIISQAKIRHNWYFVRNIVNPASVDKEVSNVADNIEEVTDGESASV